MRDLTQLYYKDGCSWYKGYAIIYGVLNSIDKSNYIFSSTIGLSKYNKNILFYVWGSRQNFNKRFDGMYYLNTYFL